MSQPGDRGEDLTSLTPFMRRTQKDTHCDLKTMQVFKKQKFDQLTQFLEKSSQYY